MGYHKERVIMPLTGELERQGPEETMSVLRSQDILGDNKEQTVCHTLWVSGPQVVVHFTNWSCYCDEPVRCRNVEE